MKKGKIDTSWLDDIHCSLERLQYVSSRLDRLSTAFHETGNSIVSKSLACDAITIDDCIRSVHGALGRMLSNDVQKGQRQLAEIFKTLAEGLEKKDGKLETSGKTETSIHGEG